MGDKLKNFTTIFTKIFENKKILTLITVIGCIGILLIGASEWIFPSENKNTSVNVQDSTLNDYIELLEEKTEKMLLSIDGAGKCKIMITAEASAKKEYATDDDITNDYESNTSETHQKSELQTEIVIIESSGTKEALITKITEPEIRGVLVLCEGADTPKVKENVTQAVKTVLGVASNKICVIKLKK